MPLGLTGTHPLVHHADVMGYHLRAEAAEGPRAERGATCGACTPRTGVGSGYRYYNPELGRWINRDPIGERGGLNVYGFSGNQAVVTFDVAGLFFEGVPGDFALYIGLGDPRDGGGEGILEMDADRFHNEFVVRGLGGSNPADGDGSRCCTVVIRGGVRRDDLRAAGNTYDALYIIAHGALSWRTVSVRRPPELYNLVQQARLRLGNNETMELKEIFTQPVTRSRSVSVVSCHNQLIASDLFDTRDTATHEGKVDVRGVRMRAWFTPFHTLAGMRVRLRPTATLSPLLWAHARREMGDIGRKLREECRTILVRAQ